MPDITGRKVVMIIASNNFRDEEYEEPRKLLDAAGASVTVASSSLDTAAGMLGARVKPDILITDVSVADYDAVVFVGGAGAREYFDNPTAQSIAKDAVAQGKLLAAICIAPSTLANAGVLKDKTATSYPSEKKNLEAKGATHTGRGVEIDGDIITADGPGSAVDFGRSLVEALAR